MRKAFKFVAVALAVLMLFQGAGFAVACDMPCKMDGAAKMRCAMACVRARKMMGSVAGEAVLLPASCIHVRVTSPLPALATVRVAAPERLELRTIPVPSSFSAVRWSTVLFACFDRAGPPFRRTAQPFMAVPPQNAPPASV